MQAFCEDISSEESRETRFALLLDKCFNAALKAMEEGDVGKEVTKKEVQEQLTAFFVQWKEKHDAHELKEVRPLPHLWLLRPALCSSVISNPS
jgi:hypothetical protein